MATLLIVGASGKMGTALVTAALAAGHRVNALVRSRAKAAHLPAGVTIFEGDGRDGGALAAALKGTDAVVIPAGGRKEPVTAQVVGAALPAMGRLGIKRLIVLSAYGALDGAGFYRWMMQTLAKAVSVDKVETERLLRASSADWTAVRPGILTDGPATGKVRAGENVVLKGMPQVSRADVAAFVMGELDTPRFVRKSPVVYV